MTDRPIIFSGPMVQALLDGRKTQTRRLLKKPTWAQDKGWPEGIMDEQDLKGRLSWFHRNTGCLSLLPIPQPSDRLYVREPWRAPATQDAICPSDMVASCLDAGYSTAWNPIQYEADGLRDNWSAAEFGMEAGRLRSGMHMPRPYSRLTLTVTDVRVQRLQDISDADAMAEGVEPYGGIDPECSGFLNYKNNSEDGYWITAKHSFRTLWNSLHGPDAWDHNPWVAAYTFTVQRGNINEVKATPTTHRQRGGYTGGV